MQPQANTFQPRILAGASRSLWASPAWGCRCDVAQQAREDAPLSARDTPALQPPGQSWAALSSLTACSSSRSWWQILQVPASAITAACNGWQEEMTAGNV